uniref:Uncharacterized protein n=1 Tax=Rhizophora mucronata TaxID=61149 RepID=A0A2P2PUU6_RHIMU
MAEELLAIGLTQFQLSSRLAF